MQLKLTCPITGDLIDTWHRESYVKEKGWLTPENLVDENEYYYSLSVDGKRILVKKVNGPIYD